MFSPGRYNYPTCLAVRIFVWSRSGAVGPDEGLDGNFTHVAGDLHNFGNGFPLLGFGRQGSSVRRGNGVGCHYPSVILVVVAGFFPR